MSFKPGLYQHYKGGLYWVVDTAKHSETLEEMVVYRKYFAPEVYGDFWVRPASMWSEEVRPGVPRFKKVDDVQK